MPCVYKEEERRVLYRWIEIRRPWIPVGCPDKSVNWGRDAIRGKSYPCMYTETYRGEWGGSILNKLESMRNRRKSEKREYSQEKIQVGGERGREKEGLRERIRYQIKLGYFFYKKKGREEGEESRCTWLKWHSKSTYLSLSQFPLKFMHFNSKYSFFLLLPPLAVSSALFPFHFKSQYSFVLFHLFPMIFGSSLPEVSAFEGGRTRRKFKPFLYNFSFLVHFFLIIILSLFFISYNYEPY